MAFDLIDEQYVYANDGALYTLLGPKDTRTATHWLYRGDAFPLKQQYEIGHSNA